MYIYIHIYEAYIREAKVHPDRDKGRRKIGNEEKTREKQRGTETTGQKGKR